MSPQSITLLCLLSLFSPATRERGKALLRYWNELITVVRSRFSSRFATCPLHTYFIDTITTPGRRHPRLSQLKIQWRIAGEGMFVSGVMDLRSFLFQWSDSTVIVSVAVAAASFISFLLVELFVAREPVLAPGLLKQKIPVLVGTSNFLVAICNFAVNYFYPMWFQTVMSTSAATAGKRFKANKSLFSAISWPWPTKHRSTSCAK